MLQAREKACIFLLLAGLALGGGARAQEPEERDASPDFKRIGAEPVENEPVLDLSLPQPEQKPETPEQRVERLRRERQAVIDGHLAAAQEAMLAGRVDQPPEDSAWTHYREALDLDPGNEAARAGLASVQAALIERALAYARDLDFETADRVLEDAALVTDDLDTILRAKDEISEFREEYAAVLEVQAVSAMDAGRFEQAERALIGLVALGGMDSEVNRLRRRMEEARVYGGLKPGQVIRDHFVSGGGWSPESVIIEAGSFQMGSIALEEGREDNEGPQHRVTFRRGFAIGQSEVTVGQFRAFVDMAGYRTDAEKHGYSMVYDHYSGRLARRDDIDWEHDYEGRPARAEFPVVHVSFNDALAYVKWLARNTGKPYRLPSEAEFEFALRAGRLTRFWWGDGSPARTVENLTGQHDVSKSRRKWEIYFEGYGDRHWGPAPAMSFEPNPFGLYDMGGNVAEWVMDCWHDSYIRAPDDGSAWVNPGCDKRVVRGGYWASSPDQARSAFRLPASSVSRDARVGFRVARDL